MTKQSLITKLDEFERHCDKLWRSTEIGCQIDSLLIAFLGSHKKMKPLQDKLKELLPERRDDIVSRSIEIATSTKLTSQLRVLVVTDPGCPEENDPGSEKRILQQAYINTNTGEQEWWDIPEVHMDFLEYHGIDLGLQYKDER